MHYFIQLSNRIEFLNCLPILLDTKKVVEKIKFEWVLTTKQEIPIFDEIEYSFFSFETSTVLIVSNTILNVELQVIIKKTKLLRIFVPFPLELTIEKKRMVNLPNIRDSNKKREKNPLFIVWKLNYLNRSVHLSKSLIISSFNRNLQQIIQFICGASSRKSLW